MRDNRQGCLQGLLELFLLDTPIRMRARVQLQRLRLRDHLSDYLHPRRVFDSDGDELAEGVLKAKTLGFGNLEGLYLLRANVVE